MMYDDWPTRLPRGHDGPRRCQQPRPPGKQGGCERWRWRMKVPPTIRADGPPGAWRVIKRPGGAGKARADKGRSSPQPRKEVAFEPSFAN